MKSDKEQFAILLVDDDSTNLEMLQDHFGDDYKTLTAISGPRAIEIVEGGNNIAVVVMDIKMPGMDGIEAARRIRNIDGEISIILHTAYAGEYDEDKIDELEKPFEYILKADPIAKLTRAVRNGYERYCLKKNISMLYQYAEANFGLIGRSESMQEVYRQINRVAASDGKVVIIGETGTGKELVARAIHNNSLRKDKRLVIFNCNHKAPDLVQSELFGHIRGSFTNAYSDRIGLFEYADGGTVFLDEIGDLDITTQGCLLRVLETGEFISVGSSVTKTTDIRLICATNKDLESLVETGKFRDDLYYRLRGVKILLPPLRDRKNDIRLLVEKFKDSFTVEKGLTPKIFDQGAMNVFKAYNWRGNVRELLEAVESLIIMSDSDIIMAEDVRDYLGREISENTADDNGSGSLTERMFRYKYNCVREALEMHDGNIGAAARFLKMDRSNLRKMALEMGLHKGK